MLSFLKQIYRKIKGKSSYRLKSTQSPIKSILILKNGLIDEDFKKTLLHLKEDYNFTIKNTELAFLRAKEINTFDFVIVFEGLSHEKFSKIKGVKIPASLFLNSFSLPTKIKTLKKYNLVFAPSFEMLSSLKYKGYKIHAFGIDTNVDAKYYQSLRVHRLLYNRKHNLVSEKLSSVFEKEFNNSPIWDLKYLSIQLRRGIALFENDIKRKTNHIKSSKKVKVGRHSFYNANLLLTGDEYIEIGSFCSFGKNIGIYTSNHDTNYASTQGYIYRKYFKENHPGEREENKSLARSKGPVIIKNDVWIGDGVKIMSGVTIGNGACIAAGSVVTKDVGDYEVVAGVPAKKIKMRFKNPEVITCLLESEWWNWSDTKIKNNKAFFNLNFSDFFDVSEIIEKIK